MNIWTKAALAAASGFGCYLIFWSGPGGSDDWPTLLGWLYLYGLSGLLFAAGVLFPYLRRDHAALNRGFALVIISMFSYWSALQVAMRGSWGPGTEDMLAASIVGAAIVLIGARLIIPLRHSTRLALAGVPVAIIGGLIFAWVDDPIFFVGYVAWHLLIAAVIYLDRIDTMKTRPSD